MELIDMKKLTKFYFLLLPIIICSCSMFESRDYSSQMDDFMMNDDPMFKPNSDFMVMAGDTGRSWRNDQEVNRRTPATIRNKEDYLYQDSLERELRHLENRLTEDEFYEFDRNRKKIGSISEQIYFLRLNQRERSNYLNLKGIEKNVARNSRGYYTNGPKRVGFHQPYARQQGFTFKKDVSLGMSMDDVMTTWGSPERRDIAGNPELKNERWAFRKNGRTKYIYFESGKVQGWSEQ